jgi:MEMO1 family protein
MEEIPQLRNVEAFPVQSESGEPLVCLRDPAGFAERPIFLNQTLVFLVSRMNGGNSLRDIQADFLRNTGEILPMEQLQDLVERLDEERYLDSERFRNYWDEQIRDFLQAPVRLARHANAAYQGEAEALEGEIRGFFSPPEGPGLDPDPGPQNTLRGLVAPHIDFHRGGPTYAHAYKKIAQNPEIDRIVLFGTCHTPMRQRFALTRKHFDTPFGVMETDAELVGQLASKLAEDYFQDEISHRGEHSLEFQAVFLKRALQNQPDVRIIPILVGSFHDLCEGDGTPAEDSGIETFVHALCQTMSGISGRFVVVAGADLAHVGRRFGDPSGPTEDSLRLVGREDLRFLERVADGDAEGMFRAIADDNDSRHVCGYPSIYMTLRILEKTRGELLQYRQWADLESGAAVTFAAMALY